MPDSPQDSRTGPAAPARRAAPPARLVCADPAVAQALALTPGTEVTLGRQEGCTHVLPIAKLSRRHARLLGGNGTWGIQDLDSSNGVFVNGERVRSAWLRPGDEVRLGSLAFRYEVDGAPPAEAPPPPTPETKPAPKRKPIFTPKPPTKPARRRLPRPLVIGAAVAVVALGLGGAAVVSWYPGYQKQQRIEAALADGDRAVRGVLAHGADPTRAVEEAQTLEAALDRLRPVLAELPDEPKLSEVAARLTVLAAERRFAELFARGQWREAGQLVAEVRGRLVEQLRRLPRTVRPADRKELTAAIDLLDFADVLVKLRSFAVQYPVVGAGAPATPPGEVLALIQRERKAFTLYRRAFIEVLPLEHPLIDGFVRDGERDAALVDRWIALLGLPKR
ncbi:FHA domain-containing protein [Azospirillum sp.]|uniref:FHA domain-containing protein n=1 Tax=Azospirillum sp. TaxID=34012 RepID=UPI002D3C2E35|nr:FHA domain-containing protein [Azospirillum sp.]HYD68143.1 FHA domain-containing protein [Azospirillum sp.]